MTKYFSFTHFVNSILVLLIGLLNASLCLGQQKCDESFTPVVSNPLYAAGAGPGVYIDQAHHNFHTRDGRYCGFRKILEADGYRVEAFTNDLSSESLQAVDVLVISNSLDARNRMKTRGGQASRPQGWKNPVYPAFSVAEENALVDWVEQGGSLLLIADHFPFPGAISRLARKFGIEFSNGFAFSNYDPQGKREGKIVFKPAINDSAPGLNAAHPVFQGLEGEHNEVTQVVSFTGSAFRTVDPGPANVVPLLRLPSDTVTLETDVAWKFDGIDPKPVGGWLQGAAIRYGTGRVVVLGEASMLTAQTATRGYRLIQMGVIAPGAEQNQQFVQNLLHWLDGSLANSEGAG